MISLKKLIDAAHGDSVSGRISAGEAEKCSAQLIALLSAYQSALAAMGSNGQRAIPALGEMIHSTLSRVHESLDRNSSPGSILNSGHLVEAKLVEWADEA